MNYFCNPLRGKENRDNLDDPLTKDVVKLIKALEEFIYLNHRWPINIIVETFRLSLLIENRDLNLISIYKKLVLNWEFAEYEHLDAFSYYIEAAIRRADAIIENYPEISKAGKVPFLNFIFFNLNNRKNTPWRFE